MDQETLLEKQRYPRQGSVVFLRVNEANGELSNMNGKFPLRVNGIEIRTSEALYQACRFPGYPEVQRLIIEREKSDGGEDGLEAAPQGQVSGRLGAGARRCHALVPAGEAGAAHGRVRGTAVDDGEAADRRGVLKER